MDVEGWDAEALGGHSEDFVQTMAEAKFFDFGRGKILLLLLQLG